MSWPAPDCCIRGALQKSDGAGDRAVVTTGDRGWCSGNREAAASAEATSCLISLVRRVAQQASVRTTRRSEQSSAPATGRSRSRPPASARQRPAALLVVHESSCGAGVIASGVKEQRTAEGTDLLVPLRRSQPCQAADAPVRPDPSALARRGAVRPRKHCIGRGQVLHARLASPAIGDQQGLRRPAVEEDGPDSMLFTLSIRFRAQLSSGSRSRMASSDGAEIACSTWRPFSSGPPRTMKPSSTRESMNRACSSQPSCSRSYATNPRGRRAPDEPRRTPARVSVGPPPRGFPGLSVSRQGQVNHGLALRRRYEVRRRAPCPLATRAGAP